MKTYLDYVSKDSGTIIIPRKVGLSSVVMISEEEYNSMQETLYLLSTKANREALAESIRQVGEDKTVPFEAR
ncbi:MAG TPA: type II toxin-antitoxin system Phd/YefM family antitoxin [Lunatimonas sp.]|nr:type II toxin-antitoxin system Phd/YefM family antitoxin [Lunatimonas sp.]